MKLKKLAAALIATAAMSSANAFFLYPGVTILEDDNRETLIKGAGNTATGIIQVGDKLRGVIKFSAIQQETGPGSQSPITPELTGIFETEVMAIVDADSNGIAEYIGFGPSAGFTSTYGAGAMVALFTGGSSLDIVACASIAACEAAATDGASWMTVGFGDLDDQWYAAGANLNFGAVGGLGGATKVAAVNYALTILSNGTGYGFNEQALDCMPFGPFACAGDGKTDLVGSGDVLGGRGLTNGYGARSDIDVRLSVIPEPTSLALLGGAMFGLAFVRRRKSA